MKHFFLVLFLLTGLQAISQQFTFSGNIIDSETELPLQAATVFVEKLSDSSLVAYTISNSKGEFILEGSSEEDSLRLVSTYQGYEVLIKIIPLDKKVKMLKTFRMNPATNLLGEVEIVSERAPVTVKQDTLEFNAASFNTRQNANLEDLMKKLPGVEVDAQGNITVNGKPVSKILVNGKAFFGNDPNIALKNLPKEIIDKIQVVNTKTKSEEFTGKAGDPDDKTINVTIQEDKNKGFFSRATLGGGTDDRYEMSGIANYFNNDLRLSVLGSSNNINSAGFSFDEVFDMMGGRARSISIRGNGSFSINGNSFGATGGITKSETAGLNFANEWEETYDLTADYFFGQSDTETATVVERLSFLPDRTYLTNSESESDVVSRNHRSSGMFEVEIDSMTKISIRPFISITDAFSDRSTSSIRRDNERELITATEDAEEMSNLDFSNELSFIRRFGSRGAYLQFSFSNDNQRRSSENFFFSTLSDLSGAEVLETETRDQRIWEEQDLDDYQSSLTWRSVLDDKLFLDLTYDLRLEEMTSVRRVFDWDLESEQYNLFDKDLSNDFEVRSIKHIPNAGINYEGKKLRAGFALGLLNTTLKNENFLSEVSFENHYNSLFLKSNLRYEFESGRSVFIYYRNDTEIPGITELQPVPNLMDPLNVIIGNPGLQPSLTHRINLGYNNFNFRERSGTNIYASATYYQDQVVPFSITGEDLVTTTTFRNLDGAISGYAGISMGKRYKKEERTLSYRLSLYGNYNRSIGFTNGFRYKSDRISINPSVRLGFNYRDLVEINPRYQLDYNFSDYDIDQAREQDYFNHSLALEATTYWPEDVVFGNDFSFESFGNVAPGFDATAYLWNMSLGYEFLEDNATLKLKVYDLLNENVTTRRTIGEDFVQDTQELILEQYFMMSFTYKFSKFAGKDPNKDGGIIMM